MFAAQELELENCYFYELKPKNLFNVHGNELKVVKRNGNEDQIIEHLPDSLAETITSFMRQGSLKTIKAEITGGRIAVTEVTCSQ